MRILRVCLAGKCWRFVYPALIPDHGQCDSPHKTGKAIRIRGGMNDKETLDVIAHELLHAASWHALDEGFVAEYATELARVLTEMGYTREN